jgi:hypothetical protein
VAATGPAREDHLDAHLAGYVADGRLPGWLVYQALTD